MAVDAPSRPVSSAGLDGVAVAVEPRAARPVAHVARIAIDELEDASAGRTTAAPNAPGDVLTRAPGEVSPPAASTGPLDGILTALFGFLFN